MGEHYSEPRRKMEKDASTASKKHSHTTHTQPIQTVNPVLQIKRLPLPLYCPDKHPQVLFQADKSLKKKHEDPLLMYIAVVFFPL